MSFMQLEDMTGSAEIIVFPKTFAKTEKWLGAHHVFIVKGIVDTSDPNTLKIKAAEMVPVELVFNEWSAIEYIIFLLPDSVQEETIQFIKNNVIKGKIPLQLRFQENQKLLSLKTKELIMFDQQIAQTLEEKNITVKCVL